MNGFYVIIEHKLIKNMITCIDYFIENNKSCPNNLLPEYNELIYFVCSPKPDDISRYIDINILKEDEIKGLINMIKKYKQWLEIADKYNCNLSIC